MSRYWPIATYPVGIWVDAVPRRDTAFCARVFRVPMVLRVLNVRPAAPPPVADLTQRGSSPAPLASPRYALIMFAPLTGLVSVIIGIRVHAFAGRRTSVALTLVACLLAATVYQFWVVATQAGRMSLLGLVSRC